MNEGEKKEMEVCKGMEKEGKEENYTRIQEEKEEKKGLRDWLGKKKEENEKRNEE